MTSAYLLRFGKDHYALHLDRMPFGPRSFSLTENKHDACLFSHEEAELVAAEYRAFGVEFTVEEYDA